MDDTELVAAVAAGDDTALRELFRRHAPWLAGRLRSALPAADVEDVMQETFVGVWRGASRYRPTGPVGAWIWGIARRQAALSLRRREPVTLPLPELEPAGHTDDPADAVVWRMEIAAAVTALGPDGSPDREAWRLAYVEDRPMDEVARLMGIPVGTAKSRAHRVRRILRLALGDAAAPGGGQ
jgi:RNA polymerase sigma-70 factor (ECF subfamily)